MEKRESKSIYQIEKEICLDNWNTYCSRVRRGLKRLGHDIPIVPEKNIFPAQSNENNRGNALSKFYQEVDEYDGG